jgi:hypothetical protein
VKLLQFQNRSYTPKRFQKVIQKEGRSHLNTDNRARYTNSPNFVIDLFETASQGIQVKAGRITMVEPKTAFNKFGSTDTLSAMASSASLISGPEKGL